jgi:hypothetical protein
MLAVDSIHGLYFWGPFCGTPALWIWLYVLLRKRLKPLLLAIVFLLVPIGLISVLRVTEDAAMNFAATLAVPYIQQALDEQCGSLNLVANASSYRYSLDFGIRYSDYPTVCQFDREWICECGP